MKLPSPFETHALADLTTVGRKTGRSRTVELWFAYHEGKVYLLGHRDAQWVRNLSANPQATFEVGGTVLTATASFADEKERFVYNLFKQKYGADEVGYWYGGPRGNRRTIELTLDLVSH